MALTNHIVPDSPTNNLAALNPLDTSGGTLSNNNLSYQADYLNSRNGNGVPSTVVIPSSGKWYFECNATVFSGTGNSALFGITSWQGSAKADAWYNGSSAFEFHGVDASTHDGKVWVKFRDENGVSSTASTQITVSSTYGSGDSVMIAYDLDGTTKKMWVGYEGTWYNNGDPATGTNPTYTFTSSADSWKFWAESVASSTNTNRSTVNIDFGQGFQYQIPAGYKMVAASNLPDFTPTVTDDTPQDYFKAVIWSGNNDSVRDIPTGFQPDLVWVKQRNEVINPTIQDSVRGAGNMLFTDVTAQQNTSTTYGQITDFKTTAFEVTLGSDATYDNYNKSGGTYVAWCWKSGGSPSATDDGTGVSGSAKLVDTSGAASSTTCKSFKDAAVTAGASNVICPSKMSINQAAGFSITKFTSPSTADVYFTVPHGLSSAPDMVIQKETNSTGSWPTYHSSVVDHTDKVLLLDSTNGLTTLTNYNVWGSHLVDENAVGFRTNMSFDAGSEVIMYCWHSVEGYSKFGSYTGNGSADGPMVYCGFRPAFVMLKRTDTSGNWTMVDASRDPYNQVDRYVFANESNAEATYNGVADFLSNGFKVRNANSGENATNGTYIFMAFAEQPFKFSNAR
jgi:hypothetical protein